QVLHLGDAEIASSPNAESKIARSAGRVDVVLKIGKIDLHVEHQPGRLFVVHAGDVEIEDIGTRFSVDYDGKNVDVRVTEGKVKDRRRGREAGVNASEAWPLELGKTTIVALGERAAPAAAPTPPAPAPAPVPVANPPAQSGSAGSAAKAGKPPPSNARKAL